MAFIEKTVQRLFGDAMTKSKDQDETLKYLRELVDTDPVLSGIVIKKIVGADKNGILPQFTVKPENADRARESLNGNFDSKEEVEVDGQTMVLFTLKRVRMH